MITELYIELLCKKYYWMFSIWIGQKKLKLGPFFVSFFYLQTNLLQIIHLLFVKRVEKERKMSQKIKCVLN